MTQFAKRRVGRTDLEVTELGLGTATFPGQLGTEIPESAARATIEAAIAAGIGYFDTAPMYGFGLSERLLGDALRGRQEGRVISTKVGRLLRPVRSDAERTTGNPWVRSLPFEHVYDYSYGAVMRSFEDSLQRLGLAKVDILYVHDIGTTTHGVEGNRRHWEALAGGGHRALLELKARGLVSAIGIGVNESEVLVEALGLGEWDVFLLAGRYTLLEQASLSPLLSTCLERGTSIVVGGPFNAGILAGTDIWGPDTGVYGRTPPHILARVRAMDEICRAHGVPLAAAALHFPLAHPAVCNVVPGPKSPAEFAGILDWWSTPIPDAFWAALAASGLLAPGTPVPGGRTA